MCNMQRDLYLMQCVLQNLYEWNKVCSEVCRDGALNEKAIVWNVLTCE